MPESYTYHAGDNPEFSPKVKARVETIRRQLNEREFLMVEPDEAKIFLEKHSAMAQGYELTSLPFYFYGRARKFVESAWRSRRSSRSQGVESFSYTNVLIADEMLTSRIRCELECGQVVEFEYTKDAEAFGENEPCFRRASLHFNFERMVQDPQPRCCADDISLIENVLASERRAKDILNDLNDSLG